MEAGSGRFALVTGASSGIGRAVAHALARIVDHLCLVGRDEDRLAKVSEEAQRQGAQILQFRADLTCGRQLSELATEISRRHDGLDILVHSAGIYARGNLDEASLQALDDQYRANVRAPYELTQLLLPALVRRRGGVVFLNSTQGETGSGGVGQYAATQHAMRAVADSLRAEVNAAGVRVTTLHIGRTATPRQERIHASEGRRYEPEALIQPEDIAQLVVSAVDLPRRAQVTTMTVWPTRKVGP